MSKLWQRLLRQRLQVSAPPAGGGFRYWSMHIQAVNGASFVAVEEIELRMTPAGATITTASTPAIATSQSSASYAPARTVDQGAGGTNSYWRSATSTNERCTWDLGSPASPVEFAYKAPGAVLSGAVKNFTIQGTNGDPLAGPWTDIKVVTNSPRTVEWRVVSLI